MNGHPDAIVFSDGTAAGRTRREIGRECDLNEKRELPNGEYDAGLSIMVGRSREQARSHGSKVQAIPPTTACKR